MFPGKGQQVGERGIGRGGAPGYLWMGRITGRAPWFAGGGVTRVSSVVMRKMHEIAVQRSWQTLSAVGRAERDLNGSGRLMASEYEKPLWLAVVGCHVFSMASVRAQTSEPVTLHYVQRPLPCQWPQGAHRVDWWAVPDVQDCAKVSVVL